MQEEHMPRKDLQRPESLLLADRENPAQAESKR